MAARKEVLLQLPSSWLDDPRMMNKDPRTQDELDEIQNFVFRTRKLFFSPYMAEKAKPNIFGVAALTELDRSRYIVPSPVYNILYLKSTLIEKGVRINYTQVQLRIALF